MSIRLIYNRDGNLRYNCKDSETASLRPAEVLDECAR
jgi:hypothetical protein